MSIIQSLQTFLTGYDGMSLQNVKTDRPDEMPSSYAVTMAGSGTVRRDVVGNVTYQNNYIFWAKENTHDEIDRRENYDFLEGITEWLEQKNVDKDFPVLGAGYIVRNLKVANAMLMDLYDDGTGLYQVQIQLQFTKQRGDK